MYIVQSILNEVLFFLQSVATSNLLGQRQRLPELQSRVQDRLVHVQWRDTCPSFSLLSKILCSIPGNFAGGKNAKLCPRSYVASSQLLFRPRFLDVWLLRYPLQPSALHFNQSPSKFVHIRKYNDKWIDRYARALSYLICVRPKSALEP